MNRPADETASESDGDSSSEIVSMRDQYREQMIASIGGWTGALITAVPTAVFVVVNVTTSLWPAIWAAVGSAVLLTVYRLVRRQSIQQSVSGLFGVLIAAIIAARTGQARGFFLFGIWTSFLYAAPFAISILVRRPLVGLLWEFLDPTPASGDHDERWYRRRPLLIAYTWATVAATVVFVARGVVQLTLYRHHETGWLGFAKVAMGYPLFVLAVGFAFLVVTRARKQVTAAER